jgi:hypothetical protein
LYIEVRGLYSLFLNKVGNWIQIIANISVPITLISTMWYWHHENRIKFIVRIRTLLKIVKNGIEFHKPGIELEVINSSPEIMFIELMGISKKIGILKRFCFFTLKHWGIDKRKFFEFESEKNRQLEPNNDGLIKLESGGKHSYQIIGKDYIETIAELISSSKKLTRRMTNDKAIKFFISIKVYDKKIWNTTFILLPDNKTYADVKKKIVS